MCSVITEIHHSKTRFYYTKVQHLYWLYKFVGKSYYNIFYYYFSRGVFHLFAI